MGRDIFCLKNFDTFSRTFVHESINECYCPHTVEISNVNFTNKNNPLHPEFIKATIQIHFIFYHLSAMNSCRRLKAFLIETMASGDLATEGARASATMVLTLFCCNIPVSAPGPRFNIKMSSYQYRKSHCGDKTAVRSSYLHNGISYTHKTASLYIDGLMQEKHHSSALTMKLHLSCIKSSIYYNKCLHMSSKTWGRSTSNLYHLWG